MNLIVETPRLATWGSYRFRCAIGSGGILAASTKREGDGATPAGVWPMREVLYRADRLPLPVTSLPIRPLQQNDGWCDESSDKHYNQYVRHPYPASAEHLWRDDHLYDLVVVLGHNDRPVRPGAGSAIFLHIASPEFLPSAGCVTLQKEDLLTVLREAKTNSCVEVRQP